MQLPAISVIIPLYNAEKYIGECLDSILAQTFRGFEVIVVDDCSTDSSVAVVKNYAAKFGGRLKLARTKKNSGNPWEPTEIGIALSRGEYLSILDDDDAITPTAFEELYTVAKSFDADVVACEKYYQIPDELWHNENFRQTLKPTSLPAEKLVTEPTLLTNDISERVQRFCQADILWTIWSKLIRRDFILENEITFAKTIVGDFVFTGCLLCAAERFVFVPNVVNIYRFIAGSASHLTDKDKNYFCKYLKALTPSFRHLDEFLNGREFFQRHPDKKYLVLERVWNEILKYLLDIYEQTPAHEFDDIVRKEFSVGDNVALASFTFNAANVYRVQLMQLLEYIDELEKTNRTDKIYIAELEKLVAQLL